MNTNNLVYLNQIKMLRDEVKFLFQFLQFLILLSFFVVLERAITIT